MSDQLNFFGPAAARQRQHTTPADPRRDVRRVIAHKTGPFRELRGGQVTGREFHFIELVDGRIVYEFTDNGERLPAGPFMAMQIADGIQNGMYVEVGVNPA